MPAPQPVSAGATMIPSLRQQFNASFTPEKYQRLLQFMAERC